MSFSSKRYFSALLSGFFLFSSLAWAGGSQTVKKDGVVVTAKDNGKKEGESVHKFEVTGKNPNRSGDYTVRGVVQLLSGERELGGCEFLMEVHPGKPTSADIECAEPEES